jgi:uncharacterized protein with HEPN domain
MSAKTDADYLLDMLRYAEDGHALTQGREEGELDSDPSLRYSVQYCLLIVGEAATHVSEPTRGKLPKIPWKAIIGMRNWLVHGYAKLDAATIWETATKNLPELTEEILAFLPPEQT